MKYFLLFAVAITVVACSDTPAVTYEDKAEKTVENLPPDSLLRHAVFFSFNAESSAEAIDSIRVAFSALPEKIAAIHDYEWGLNNSPEGLDKGFTHAFFVTFLSEADRDVYLPHPDHQAFVGLLGPHVKDVFVFDYWAKAQ